MQLVTCTTKTLHLNGKILLQTAIVFASPNGLKVTVEDAKCVQANAFIQAGLFLEYTLKEEQTTFKVNLTVLLVGQLRSKSTSLFYW